MHGEIIFDEEFGVCPKVQAPNGRRYPSLPHWLAQRRQKRELRGEELRLLYVALTRARDTLILTGSVSEKNWGGKWTQPQPAITRQIAGAKSFADWLALWFGARSAECGVRNQTEGALPELRWRLVADAELADGDKAESGKRKAEIELPALDEQTKARLQKMLEWQYPSAAATRRKAKSSVTELRRAAEELDEEAEPVFRFPPKRLARTPAPPDQTPRLGASDTGLAHHKFLQFVALEKTGDRAALAAEAERLVREKYLSADERAVLDLDALADFWNSPLGQKIRAQPPDSVKRELPFTAKFSPAELDELVGSSRCDDRTPQRGVPTSNEFIVVQGVADLVVLRPEEIWLVDFKTDVVTARDLPGKIKTYSPQLQIYAAVLKKIFARKVTRRALHFLAARRTEEI